MAGLLGSRNHINSIDGTSELSSSSISSPPVSPRQPAAASDTIHVAYHPNSVVHNLQRGGVVNAAAASPVQTSLQSGTATPQPDKPKRQRKKKEVGTDGKPAEDDKVKEKKPRKPREPKTTANGTTTAGAAATTTSSRKKVKVEDAKVNETNSSTAPRKANIMDLIGKTPSSSSPSNAPSAISNLVQPSANVSTSTAPSTLSATSTTTTTTTTRPISSGQRYDPVRAAMMEAAGLAPSTHLSGLVPPPQASTVVKRASASPSIASLIDPPVRSSVTTPSILRSPQSTTLTQTAVQVSPQHSSLGFAARPSAVSVSPSSARLSTALPESSADTMELDIAATSSFKPVSKEELPADLKQSKPPSTAPTPKQTSTAASRSSPSAAKGTRSGLLTTSDLTGGASTDDTLKRKGVNIDIQISLNRAGNNHINLAQEITKKYGRDALNPRAAAHREELLQVMAAAKNLGAGSADDMSLDLNSDMEDDSNVEMGGMEDTADGDKPRKRRKKVEEYDLDDEFIDDTELAWQQEAAVAKDGFFVYSGPLITEAQASRDEAAASSTRGGRGRGRGRGRGGAASTSHASLAEKKDTSAAAAASTTATSGRGRGRGRGTGAPRKPRITKADKERMEAEKTDRERAAVVLGSTPGAATPLGLSATSHTQHNGTTVA